MSFYGTMRDGISVLERKATLAKAPLNVLIKILSFFLERKDYASFAHAYKQAQHLAVLWACTAVRRPLRRNCPPTTSLISREGFRGNAFRTRSERLGPLHL
jgi:hypothetical protein